MFISNYNKLLSIETNRNDEEEPGGMIQCQQEQSNAKFDGSHTNWLTGGNFNTVFEWYL